MTNPKNEKCDCLACRMSRGEQVKMPIDRDHAARVAREIEEILYKAFLVNYPNTIRENVVFVAAVADETLGGTTLLSNAPSLDAALDLYVAGADSTAKIMQNSGAKTNEETVH